MLRPRSHGRHKVRALASYRAGPALDFARLPLAGKSARGRYTVRVVSAVAQYVREGVALEEARTRAGQERLAAQADRRVELAEEKAARALRALTCQICERDILADTGLIAHHGYTRPGDGWQTSSCFGARELPYEVSRDVLGRYVESLLAAAVRHMERRERLLAGTDSPLYEWHEYNRATGRSVEKSAVVTADTFAAVVEALPREAWAIKSPRPSYESTLALNVKEAEHREKYFRSEHKRQKKRFDEWRLTREWTGKAWGKV